MLKKSIRHLNLLNKNNKKHFSFQFDTPSNPQTNTSAATTTGLQEIVQTALQQSQQKQDLSTKKLEIFIDNLEKVRILDEKTQKIFQKTIQQYKTNSLASPAPLKNILSIFQTANKYGFDQQLLTHTFQYLAKTYKSFPESSPEYGDFSVKEVHNSWSFLDMVEDIKYGSKKGVQFELSNLADIMESLYKLDYKNYELLTTVLEKVERMLKQQDEGFEINLEDLSKNPQMHKKYYYSENQLEPESVLSNQEFQKELKVLNQFIEEEEHHQEKEAQQQQEQQEEQQELEEEQEESTTEIDFLIKDLQKIVNNTEENITTLASSIVSVREQYFKMTQSQQIADNDPFFNLQFLQIEEMLVENGLITPEEIQNTQLFQDDSYQLAQTTEILENFLAGQNQNLRQYYREFVNNYHQSVQVTHKQHQLQLKTQTYDEIITDAHLSKFLLKTAQISTLRKQDTTGKDYLSETWAQKFEAESDPKGLKKQDIEYMDIECDKIYTKAFTETLQKFQNLQGSIAQRVENCSSVSDLVQYQQAFLTLGLTELPEKTLQKLNSLPDLQAQLQQLSENQVQILLSNLTFFRQSAEYPALYANTQQLLEGKQFLFLDESLNALEFLYINAQPLDSLKSLPLFQSLLKQFSDNFAHFEFMDSISETTKHKISTLSLFLQAYPELVVDNAKVAEQLDGFTLYYQEKAVSPIRSKIIEFLNQNYQKEQRMDLDDIKMKNFPEFFRPDYTKFQIQNGQLQRKGLYLLDSDYISIDQSRIDGRIQFWTEILHKLHNIEPTFVKYLTLENNKLTIQNTEILQKFAMPTPPVLPVNFQVTTLETLLNSEENSVTLNEVSRIFDRLEILREKTESGIEILSLSALEEIKFSLFELSELFSKLSESTFSTLKSALNIENPQDFLLQTAQKFHQSTSQNLQSSLNSYSYIGKRLTSELLSSSQQQQKDVQPQNLNYVNYQQLTKQSYHDYEDWKTALKGSLSVSQLMSQEVNQNNQFLCSNNEILDNGKEVTIIPNKKVDRNVIRPLSYPLNWEAFYLQNNDEKAQTLQKLHTLIQSESEQSINNQTKLIANLQNFKYELRNQQNAEQIPEFLARFEFVSQLAEQHLSQKQVEEDQQFTQALPRDGEAFFNYLEKSSNQSMYNSNYVKFFLEKAQKKQKIISLWNLKNKHFLKQQYKKLQKGKISRQQFENTKKNINQELLKELKSLDHNAKEEVLLQGPSRKFIDVSLDIQAFIADKKGQIYSRFQDSDFIATNGDAQKSLDLKRFRAEQNLIKMAILLKSEKNLPLSQSEQQYAKLWVAGNLPEGNQEFTYRKIGSLSENDKKLLKMFQFSDLTAFEEFALNDIIFEFTQLLNTDILVDFEFKIKENFLKEKWNINTELLNTYQTTNLNNYWIQKAENLAWNEGQVLNEQELEDLLEILTILRDKTPKQRQELAKNQVQDKSAFEAFNNLNTRLPLIEKYIKLREIEQTKGVDFTSYKVKENKKIQQIWEKTFETSYENTTEAQLNEFVNNLLARFHLLSKFPPMSFSNFLIQIISHPKLNPIDRDMIVGFVNVFEPELKMDSQDVLKLAEKSNQIKEKHSQKYNGQEIKEKIRSSSLFQYNSIFQKIQQL